MRKSRGGRNELAVSEELGRSRSGWKEGLGKSSAMYLTCGISGGALVGEMFEPDSVPKAAWQVNSEGSALRGQGVHARGRDPGSRLCCFGRGGKGISGPETAPRECERASVRAGTAETRSLRERKAKLVDLGAGPEVPEGMDPKAAAKAGDEKKKWASDR